MVETHTGEIMDKVPYEQPTSAPTNKVTAATLAAAIVFLISWALHELTGVDISLPVQGALMTVAVFAFGYFVPNVEAPDDAWERDDPIDPRAEDDLVEDTQGV